MCGIAINFIKTCPEPVLCVQNLVVSDRWLITLCTLLCLGCMLPAWLLSADKECFMATVIFCWLCSISKGPWGEGGLIDSQTDMVKAYMQRWAAVIFKSLTYSRRVFLSPSDKQQKRTVWPKLWRTSTFSLKCYVSGRGNAYLADRRHSAVWWRNPCVLVVHKHQIQQQNLQTPQNKNASTMTTCHKNTKFTSQSAFAAFFFIFVLTLSTQLVSFFLLKSRVCLFCCWEKLLMDTDDVSGSFSFFLKNGCVLKEAIHPSIHLSTATVCSELPDETVIKAGLGG